MGDTVIPEMLALIEDTDGGAFLFQQMFAFAEANDLVKLVESESPEQLALSIVSLLEGGSLTEAQQAQLEGFGKSLSNLVHKGAKAVGRVHHAYQRARDAYQGTRNKLKKFKSDIKHAARSGFSAGHGQVPKAPVKRPVKVPK